jgi:5-methyltetrahydrofolate--homocysteine methyltransferase
MISVTIEPWERCWRGRHRGAVGFARHVHVLSLGLNCATGPEFMTDHVRTLQALTNRAVSCYPNAGLPNEEGLYQETPTTLADNWKNSSTAGG